MAEALPPAYFDTSALVKRYVVEEGSLHVRRLLRRYGVISSAVFHVEIGSALRRRKTEGRLSAAALKRVLDRIRSDAASWSLVAVADEVLALARDRVLQHPLRSLDAIHLASAESIRREGVVLPFVTADARQAAAARAVGLDVIDAVADRRRRAHRLRHRDASPMRP
ncbi:MAG TPA: type II toxin-antitoxin system VapC family toxin [Candidatus Binatia bacterium]|nr:type II toxin-antitoxin system VapC family toxin [Candidatus Binatia bacterium]